MDEQLVTELIETHERINGINEEIIKTQKEHIEFLKQSIEELKKLVETYLLKDIQL
jgi:vacuolar-type H+-ATPase subunit D/Vma8